MQIYNNIPATVLMDGKPQADNKNSPFWMKWCFLVCDPGISCGTTKGALCQLDDCRWLLHPGPLDCYSSWYFRCVVSHGNPEKMFPSNVLISLEAEKNPLSLIENPHKSPFRNFFYDHSKVELFSFLCSNFYKKILSITRQRKDATAVAQLTLILNARVSYHKCHTHSKLDAFWYRFTK